MSAQKTIADLKASMFAVCAIQRLVDASGEHFIGQTMRTAGRQSSATFDEWKAAAFEANATR